ncbi:glycerophosphodiester phosphodiesterase [Arthrobacter sp. zg-Y895]|uniref:glycerophosphodiester phosphodiesterase n=1 Tax=Arthrobacter sp. zg-Y895 TaxID=2886933 RepID=UPI001D13D740|nr:glycerophosphodiester phosphodiesterase family protein [Arthrobacter sp. zg-Y895]MCC3300198.1 glycerophosphodiester phosphodiesterase [Arthrobacter sp. zg-Y895]
MASTHRAAAPAARSLSNLPAVIAHRGYSSAAPENTLPAFAAAAAAGAAMIETDLRLTADGTAVLLHDAKLGRTTNLRGRVGRTSAARLAMADAGAWFSKNHAGVPVPTLGDLLTFLSDWQQLGLVLEFKGEWSPRQVEPVGDALWAAGLEGRMLVQAFSRRTVGALALAAPEFRRGLLVGQGPSGRHGETALQRFLFRVDAAACNPGARFLAERPDLLERLRADGLSVYPWTLDRPAQWLEAFDSGVDGIITNRPGALAAWGNTRGGNWTAGAI